MKSNTFKYLTLLALIPLAACSGGGSGSSLLGAVAPAVGAPTTGYPVTSPPGTTTKPSSQSTAAFTIKVPSASTASASSSSRSPQYVSTNTQSIKIDLTSVNGAAYSATPALVVALNTSSSSYNAATKTYTVSFPLLPPGTDGFTLSTYAVAVPDANSAVLSTNTVLGIIAIGQTTDIPVTLQGVVASLAVSLGNSPAPANYLTPGTPGSFPMLVTANDASGAQIVGSAVYNNGPVTMTTDDLLKAISFSGLSYTSPASVNSFSYNGTTLADSTEHIIATDGGVTANALVRVNSTTHVLSIVGIPVDASPLTFPVPAPGSNGGPYALQAGNDSSVTVLDTQAGWGTAANPFTATSSNALGLNVKPLLNNQFVITGLPTQTASTADVTITGGAGQSDVIHFTLTGSANGGNFQVQSVRSKI